MGFITCFFVSSMTVLLVLVEDGRKSLEKYPIFPYL